MPTKNGEIIAAIAVVPYGETDLLAGEAERLSEPRAHGHGPAPQTKYWRNISAESFSRTVSDTRRVSYASALLANAKHFLTS